MFDLNFIAEPGVQIDNTDASWSFLHKRSQTKTIKSIQPDQNIIRWKLYGAIGVTIIILFIGFLQIMQTKVDPNMVLNQVIDLIVESGYISEIQLAEAHFNTNHVNVIIRSDELNGLQKFTQGYRIADIIPYEMYIKENINYVSLNFPWKVNQYEGDITSLVSLASKTVFSNKIAMNHTDNSFKIIGRSSDIISYLLQMADSGLIQKFTLLVQLMESGRFSLKIERIQI
jgi:hypothetical protein